MNRDTLRKTSLIAVIAILLGVAFIVTTMLSFLASRGEMHDAIVSEELPLTADTIYSEIQRDLIRPILVSSTMANDTFFRDWVISGERDIGRIEKYLLSVKEKYNTVSSFFVSEVTRKYYTADGILKNVSETEPRDVWYFRVRKMGEEYETNIDPDLANKDTLTIFINYKVFDYSHNFIGTCGVGLTISAVRDLIGRYQENFRRDVYFVDSHGKVAVAGEPGRTGVDIHDVPGLTGIADAILNGKQGAFTYSRGGETHLLNVRFIPELHWYVFVEKIEEHAMAGVRRVLYTNLVIALVATLIVLAAVTLTIDRFQRRLEEMATTDRLTGLVNRQSYEILVDRAIKESRRTGTPVSVVLFDIDHFKAINDRYGHLRGDLVLRKLAEVGFSWVRESDVACRWGGEEFLILLHNCRLDGAVTLAEKIRRNVAALSFMDVASDLHVTLSAGVAQLGDDEDQEHLLKRADTALYRAKHEGRNRVIADGEEVGADPVQA